MTQPKKTAGEMFPLIECYLEGHTTQKAFAAEHGISTSLLNYWLAKYRRERADEPGAFEQITPTTSVDGALLEIVYPHGVRLRLFAPVEPAQLDRLLAPGRQRA